MAENFHGEISLTKDLKQRGLSLIVIETFFYLLTILVALIGNTLVLLAIYRNPRLRTTPNCYIATLAITDILLPLLCAPYSLAALVLGYWPFNDNACQTQGYLVIVLACCSLQIMTLTAINRYFRIVRSFRYQSLFRRRNIIFMIALSCVLACMEPLPYLLSGRRYVFHPGKVFCFQTVEISAPNFLVYVYVGLPTFTLSVCYALVFKKLRAHQRTVQTSLRSSSQTEGTISIADVKVTKVLFLTVLGFLVCWTPIAVIDFVDIMRDRASLPRQVYVLYLFLGNLSGVFNPFAYGVLNRSFREEFKKVFIRKQSDSKVLHIRLQPQNLASTQNNNLK